MKCVLHQVASARVCLLSTLVISLALGCNGGDNGPELAEVMGKVTLDDQPLPNARVVFLPEDGPASAAITNESGEYELIGKSGVKGGVPGTNRVEISTDLDGTNDRAKEKVPAQYNVRSTLTATVETGSNNFDFKLLSK